MMTPKPTNRDTTIEDIHRTRMRLAEKFGGDIAAILEDARKRQEASGRALWRGAVSGQCVAADRGRYFGFTGFDLLTFNVSHFVRMAAFGPGVVVVDPATV